MREILRNCENERVFSLFNNRIPNFWNFLSETLIYTEPLENLKAKTSVDRSGGYTFFFDT